MRNAKGVTHTAYVRGAVHKADEAAVQFFTYLTDEEYFNLKHDMGKRWMQVFFARHGFTEDDGLWLWNWPEIMQVWNNHWRRMDNETILPILHKVMEAERENVYREMHLDVFEWEHTRSVLLQKAMVAMIRIICTNNRKDMGWAEKICMNVLNEKQAYG